MGLTVIRRDDNGVFHGDVGVDTGIFEELMGVLFVAFSRIDGWMIKLGSCREWWSSGKMRHP